MTNGTSYALKLTSFPNIKNMNTNIRIMSAALRGTLTKDESTQVVRSIATSLSLPRAERNKALIITIGSLLGLAAGALIGARFGAKGPQIGKEIGRLLGGWLAEKLYDSPGTKVPQAQASAETYA